ncbi:hypothetical protein ACRAVF_33755 (plasmid) [Bradyrhizobium oligotrophicum S58]
MTMLLAILITPGLVVLYAIVLRPLLRKRFAAFYDQADGFWAKLWAICGKSVTVLWGYVLGGIGVAFSMVDQLAAAAGDPNLNLKQQVIDALQNNPQYLGYALTAISILTIIARVRSIGKA